MTDLSRREQLEAAFDEHADELEEPKTPELEPPEGQEDAESGVVAEEQTGADGKPAPKLGPDGKPLPDVQPAKPIPEARQGEKPAKKVEEPKPSPYKPPASWRPEKREKFMSAPIEVQEEITRREAEIDNTLRQTAQVRQYASRLNQTIAPYEAMIRAEGGDHFTAVDNLLKTAYHLRTANPQAKAQMVAQMIFQHGVDINLLDTSMRALLDGKQVQQRADPQLQFIQKELEPIKQFMSGLQTRQQQVTQEQVEASLNEMETFAADPKNEYFNDVRPYMADLMETATKNGIKMTLQDAYARATLLHPTISQMVINKRMSDSAAQRNAAAKKARNASASLPSGGAPAGAADQGNKPKPNNRRSAIEAAWDAAEEAQ